jgi:hypothetical protein
MKDLLKWPLIIAAILVVARIVLEQAGAPDSINNLVSVAVFYVSIAPLYFAFRISKSEAPRPYLTLLKNTALFAALARSMVIPTYWLAYIFQWPQGRFSVDQGGVVGPGVTPLRGFILVPLFAAAAWVVFSVVAGGGLGSIVIAVKRAKSASAENAKSVR